MSSLMMCVEALSPSDIRSMLMKLHFTEYVMTIYSIPSNYTYLPMRCRPLTRENHLKEAYEASGKMSIWQITYKGLPYKLTMWLNLFQFGTGKVLILACSLLIKRVWRRTFHYSIPVSVYQHVLSANYWMKSLDSVCLQLIDRPDSLLIMGSAHFDLGWTL